MPLIPHRQPRALLLSVLLFSPQLRADSFGPSLPADDDTFSDPQLQIDALEVPIEVPAPRPIEDEGTPPPLPQDQPLRAAPGARWSGSLGLSYIGSFEAADPYLIWAAQLQRTASEKSRFFIEQSLVQNTRVDASKEEWEGQDTRIGFSYSLGLRVPLAMQQNLSVSSSLPLSKRSQANSIWSQPRLAWAVSYPWNASFSNRFAAAGTYTWSEFETAESTPGSGGEALPLVQIDLSGGSSWLVKSNWSIGLNALYSEIIYHAVSYEGQGDPAIDEQPSQAYALDLSLAWTPRPWMGWSLSYGQGSLLAQSGFDDYVLFDRFESKWVIGLQLSSP